MTTTTTWEPDLVAPLTDEELEQRVRACAADLRDSPCDQDAVVALLHVRG